MRSASTRFSPLPDLEQAQLALDAGAFDGQVMDLVHGHDAAQLRLDLLDHRGRAARHDGDARAVAQMVDLGHGQAVDVVAAAGKQADDAGQHARPRYRPAPPACGFRWSGHWGRADHRPNGWSRPSGCSVPPCSSRFPKSQTRAPPAPVMAPSVEASPSSISLCGLPEGIIGKQFSCFSTSTSRMNGPS
jgi:hypothetical protein